MSKRTDSASKKPSPPMPPGVVLLHVPADNGPKAGDEFDEMIDKAMKSRPQLVIVDLAERNFISTVMLGLLLKLRRETASFNGQVRLADVQPTVRGVLSVCRLDRLFGVYPTVQEAIDAVEPKPSPRP